MSRKVWLVGAAVLLLTAGLCIAVPRLAGFVLILLALGAVAIVAFRML